MVADTIVPVDCSSAGWASLDTSAMSRVFNEFPVKHLSLELHVDPVDAVIESSAPRAVLYSTLSPTELIRECSESGETAAWEEFIRRFQRLISVVALRTASHWAETSPALIDDLVQETYLKLCADRGRVLRNFEPHHPEAIYGFLKVLTANVVNDYFKARLAAKRGAGQTEQGFGLVEPMASDGAPGSAGAMERDVLLKEIDVFLQTLPQRDRLIFQLYYRQGMAASAIASLPTIELTTKGVESTLHRVTQIIRGWMVEKAQPEKGIRAGESF
jgi:RNA polymerase sigma-70 factor, ECF subfamily